MMCKYLKLLENSLHSAGIKETYRGQSWGEGNEWFYFDCVLNTDSLREQHWQLDFIKYQEYEGNESGFYCEKCRMGIMGLHPKNSKGRGVVSNFASTFKIRTLRR